jgi:AcrR family transcriptional regulator
VARGARKPVDQNGRALGPRALQTRQRLLEATQALLEERGLRDISVVEIARKVETSPATFYQYFKDVADATLQLAEQAGAEVPGLVAKIEQPWTGRAGFEVARALVEGFIDHWDAHRAVLRIRNLASEEGDRRFQKARRDSTQPVLDGLAAKVREAQAAGRLPAQIHPYAAAAALASMLERLAAFHRELQAFGVSREDLVETCARILVQSTTGRTAPD